MANDQNPKQYDPEERTFLFAVEVRSFIKYLKKTTAHIEDGKQLIRSSVSVAANYIETNDSLSKKILYTVSRFAGKRRKKVGCFCV